MGSPWADPIYRNFEYLFTSGSVVRVTLNTLFLNALFITFGVAFQVTLAIIFNELAGQNLEENNAIDDVFAPFYVVDSSWRYRL